MNKFLLTLLSLFFFSGSLMAQSPIIDSWTLNSNGTIARYYVPNGTLTSTALPADVTQVCYSTDSVWIKTTGMPAVFGPWSNPGAPTDQDFTFRFPRNPSSATVKTSAPVVFAVGVLTNGAAIFANGDAKSYKSSTNSNVSNGDGKWNGNAYYSEGMTLDTSYAGHVNQDGTYHSHATPFKLYKNFSSSVHSPIVGFAFDGYPIYGPFGYSSPLDAASSIIRISSSYQLRNITTRTTLPDGTTSSPAGPNVSQTFPLGMYMEDFEYVSGLGDLDQYNGRYCKTPEYPNGTYAYFVTTETNGTPKYPYYIGTAYYGVVDAANLSINSTVTMPANPTGCLPLSTSGPTVTLSAASNTIIETGGSTTVTATLSATSASNVIVYLSFGGTASGSGVDYSSSATSITIPAGSTSKSITISSVGDTQDETDETVIVSISSVTNGTESGSQSQTITISDDDNAPAGAPTVSFNGPTTATIAENAATMNIGVTLSAAYTSSVTVTLGFTGTATGSGNDYSVSSAIITIPAGAPGGSITLTPVNDTKDEPNETIIVNILSVVNGTENGTQTKTITITDDDNAPNVTLSATPLTISETGGSSTVTATLSAISGYDVTVNLGYSGTATSSDYTTSGASISILAGNYTGTITLNATSDLLVESNETIIVDITSATNATEATTQQQTVTITDDGNATPSVTLTASSNSIAENGSSIITATLSSTTGVDVIVNLEYTGTATGSGTDYTASATSITIAAGSTTGTITITSVNDTKDENDETVIADITSVTNATEATAQTVTVTITDDDSAPNVTLSGTPLSISETGGSSTVTATLAAASGLDVTVNLEYTGTATGSGTDYTASATSITITAGSTTGSVTLTSISDTKDESDETVIVDITSATNATEATTETVTVTIADDDATPNVTLSATSLSISETGGSSTVTATLAAASGLDVTVNLGYTGTATGSGTDYTASATSITISAGSTTGTVIITSAGDTKDENDETVIVDITSVTNATEATAQTVTVTITDDDAAPNVTLSATPLSISETGGSSTVTATLAAASGLDVTVNLGYTGTATGSGTDYTASATSITISAGSTTGTVTITSAGDTKDENDETVIVDITSVTNATEATAQTVTVTITDDDAAPNVTLSATPLSISETGGSSTVTATLAAASGLDVTVNLGYTGTATGSGTDYTASATSITISAGSTTGTVTITSAGDTKDENDETVIVDITSVTNATEATAQTVTVTIGDDDAAPNVTLSATPLTIAEAGGISEITATIDAVSGLDIIIYLAYTGNATGSSTDYNVTGLSITIASGSTTGSVTITAVDDLLNDANENVVIDISSVSNATEVNTQQVTIAIEDDEIPTGITTKVAREVTIYPNPTYGVIHIDLKEEVKEIVVMNNNGAVVKMVENPSYNNLVDLSEFSEGIYFLQIKSDVGVTTRKVDLQK